jgi:inorganic pyrophosphatase
MNQFTRWRPHPWHGLEPGPQPPAIVTAYIEITPFDVVKYEVDKPTGYLKVDRPQQTSSSPPTLYGFIPRTYCAERVAQLTPQALRGDGDPLDICVISERPINRADIILTAHVVGGLQMLDRGDADDKIIAVLARDPVWGEAADLSDLPSTLIDRLAHYFGTYKLQPGEQPVIAVSTRYNRRHAEQVIEAAREDYRSHFPGNGTSPTD